MGDLEQFELFQFPSFSAKILVIDFVDFLTIFTTGGGAGYQKPVRLPSVPNEVLKI